MLSQSSSSPVDHCSTGIRRMGLGDLSYVIATHVQHFPDGFFAQLGPAFLTRYYRTFLDGPTSVAILAELDGVPVGYLTGVVSVAEHRRLLLRFHGSALAIRGAAALVRHPSAAWRFLLTRLVPYVGSLRHHLGLSRRSQHPASAQERDLPTPSPAVLSHLVVDPSRRLRGVGTELVNRFIAEAHQAGCSSAVLVTLAGSEAGAFYERLGWTRTGSRTTRDGVDLCRYEISFMGASTHSPSASNGR